MAFCDEHNRRSCGETLLSIFSLLFFIVFAMLHALSAALGTMDWAYISCTSYRDFAILQCLALVLISGLYLFVVIAMPPGCMQTLIAFFGLIGSAVVTVWMEGTPGINLVELLEQNVFILLAFLCVFAPASEKWLHSGLRLYFYEIGLILLKLLVYSVWMLVLVAEGYTSFDCTKFMTIAGLSGALIFHSVFFSCLNRCMITRLDRGMWLTGHA